MIRTIDGLTFKVHSPSLLELVSVRDDIDDPATVSVCFVGHAWVIDYQSSRHSVQRLFPSREAAIGMIASRAQ